MAKADTMIKVMKIDTCDVNLHKPNDNVDIGMAAKMHVVDYKQKKNYKLVSVQKFQKEVCQFLSGLTEHMSLKCPLKYLIVRCASAVNPNNLPSWCKSK